MSEWERQLEEYGSLLERVVQKAEEGEVKLRFGNSSIKASAIASQYFCEKKVEMQYLHGEIETEWKTLGTEAHEKLSEDSVKTERRDLWKRIYEKEPIFALEMPLLARYKDLILAGRPDSVLFCQGLPLIILEYKFSRSQRAFRDHHAQARTYGIILRNMGFETNRLFYAIVIADPKARDDKKLKERVVDAVMRNGPQEAVLTTENARVYLNRFDQTMAEKDLDWAIEFWKKRREAIPTRNPNKCRSCEYNLECDARASS